MLNEGAADGLLPITRKGADDVDTQRSHLPSQPPYPNQLVKKWTERVDRCLEQQWKDSQHLLSFAKALKDSGGTIINSENIVKELSGLGFAMMQKSIDLRQEIVNESYNNDFFDCHIKKPAYQYQPKQTSIGVLNSPRQKCSSFYLPYHTPLLPKKSSVDTSPYKIPSDCQGYTSSYSYRQQRTRSNSFSQRPLSSSSDKRIGVPLLSSSPSISNVCGLSLSYNDNVIKDQQDSCTDNIGQYQCTCNADTSNELSASGKMMAPVIRCQQCTSANQSISGSSTTPCKEDTLSVTGANDKNAATNHETIQSSPMDTTDNIMVSKSTTSIPLHGSAAAAAAASLAAHITPSTPSSSSSMVHTMSTKFHFNRSTTSLTADRNKSMSRSSSSSSSASSSASLRTTPLGFLSKDSGKSSTRFVQSLLNHKPSLPSLFTSSKKDDPSSKTDT